MSVEESSRRVTDAALRLIGNDGLDAVTFSTTAAEAGVSRGLVQHLFGTREALLRGAAVRLRERIDERIVRREPRTPRQRLIALLGALIPDGPEAIDDAYAAAGLLVLVRRDTELRAAWTRGRAMLRTAVEAALREAGSAEVAPTASALIGQAADLHQAVLVGELAPQTAQRQITAAIRRATPNPVQLDPTTR